MEKIEGTIAVLDDDKDVLLSARMYLDFYFERVIILSNPLEMMPVLHKEKPDLVLIDMNYRKGRNDGSEGLQMLKRIKDDSSAQVVVMTAYSDVNVAVEAIKYGAFDFIVKPWSNEKLLATLMAAMRLRKSERERKSLESAKRSWSDQPSNINLIGESEAIERIRSLVKQVSATDASVLLLGENGTGKEVIAAMLHEHSLRKDEPFVKVDLGAVPDTLIESELFGAKKGAYTGLNYDKQGRFQLAHKGTLFLDEIGNISSVHQVKLLSALQNRTIIPVGSNEPVPIDIRLISATNADLETEILEGDFRQDLLYRIKTIEIKLPPLRERAEDIPLLADYFLQIYRTKYGKPDLRFDSTSIRAMIEYRWPGNVRELQHALERAVILASGNRISALDVLPDAPRHETSPKDSQTLDDLERNHIDFTLAKHKGNVSQAAKALGLSRAALYRRMEKHGLE